MRLADLRVVHLPKSRSGEIPSPFRAEELLPGSFLLDSCQRWLWLSDASSVRELESPAFEVYSGADAYHFILRVSAGLESQIIGETDIFGQLKESWKKFQARGNVLSCELDSWMQRLFEDTKEIRSSHLQHLGGATYGALVRKLLELPGPIVLLGAGQIARSVAPYLLHESLSIQNRSSAPLASLVDELKRSRAGSPVEAISSEEAEARAWARARNAVICIPVGSELDGRAMKLWLSSEGARTGGTLLHLGAVREQCAQWSGLPGFKSLTDVFALQKSQGEVRSIQVAQALRACEERSKLRALGGSISISHGWEDLASFL